MAFATLANLKSTLGTGSRPNLFSVGITFPGASAFTAASPTTIVTNGELLCKAAAAPAMTIGQIEVPVKGRSVKVPGDRSFAEWTATFLSDSGFTLRKKMEEWVDYVKDPNFASASLRKTGATGDDYYGSIVVKQHNDADKALRTYTLALAFPTEVSAMDVSYDTTDAIQEFTVTFQYSYFTVATPTA